MRPSIARHLSLDSARDPELVEWAALSGFGNPQRMLPYTPPVASPLWPCI